MTTVTAAAAQDVPERYPPTSARWKLVAGGLGLTAASYGVGALTSSAWPEVPGSEALYVPVAGPWIMLAQSGCSADNPDCGALVVVRGVLLVLDGLIQAGGLGVAAEGLFMTTEADAPAPKTTAAVRPSPIIRPVPIISERQTGLGLAGAF